MAERKKARAAKPRERPRFEVRVPGFVSDEVIGLGDTVKYVSSAIGIRPCSGCSRRAAALNRLVAFRGRRPPATTRR